MLSLALAWAHTYVMKIQCFGKSSQTLNWEMFSEHPVAYQSMSTFLFSSEGLKIANTRTTSNRRFKINYNWLGFRSRSLFVGARIRVKSELVPDLDKGRESEPEI